MAAMPPMPRAQGFHHPAHKVRPAPHNHKTDEHKAPSSVRLNGNKIHNWKYDEAGKLTISLAQKNSTEKQKVTIL